MHLSASFSAAVELLGSVLAGEGCSACQRPLLIRAIFCSECAASIEHAPFDGRKHIAPFVYGGAIADAIVAFKYDERPELARPLSHLIKRGLPRLGDFAPDVVIPVPLHPTRLAERGFNQAALLARPVATALDSRFCPLALSRTRDTPRQAQLERATRLNNVVGAFSVRTPKLVQGSRVLLVDDVRTTGATLDACAEVLTQSGAEEVRTLVIARTE
jgi:ComF family protein